MICLSLTAPTLEENLRFIRRYRTQFDLLELRLDLLRQSERYAIGGFAPRAQAAAGTRIPLIITARVEDDGGNMPDDADRLRLLELGLKTRHYAYIDLELRLRSRPRGRRLAAYARRNGARIIRSHHDLDGIAHAADYLSQLASEADEIPKLAVTPRSTAELHQFIQVIERYSATPRILVGMGDFGFPTRILTRRLGSMLTYCSPADGRQAAPGHSDPTMLRATYGYATIDAETQLFGIIGNPVLHTLSPAYHNRRFREAGLNARYVPFPCDDPCAFLRLADLLGIRGFSITIPHKEAILACLDGYDEQVRAIGACNTAIREASGWHGLNTDADGFWKPLSDRVELWRPFRALIIGAGGAARAICSVLLRQGAELLILNRTVANARQLADRLLDELDQNRAGDQAENGVEDRAENRAGEMAGGRLRPRIAVGGLDAAGMRQARGSDLIVQTTSVGMEPHVEADPLPDYHFRGTEIVCDIIYAPRYTHLLARAQRSGCQIIDGSAMFNAQAASQLRLFVNACR